MKPPQEPAGQNATGGEVAPSRSEAPRSPLARIPLLLWLGLLAALLLATASPVSDRASRLFVVLAAPALWLGAAFLLRRRRRLALAVLAPGVLAGLFLCLPGRRPDPERLRAAYVRRLALYEGAPYLWGGENRRGVDCSGLVRRALVEAEAGQGLRTLDPGLLRSALSLWWHDRTARELMAGHRGETARVFPAGAINAIGDGRLLPGDLAVTASGAHVLAYLGDGEWIDADPDHMKVVRMKVPAESAWFRTPVVVVRWAVLEPR